MQSRTRITDTNTKKSELLLPAGDLTKLKTAILYGADAVYAGTPDMSLRSQSKMSLEELKEGIDFVHAHGKKIYLTLNLYTHNRDVEKLPHFVETLRSLKPDGVLIADPGVFKYLKDNAPELKRFVSTQANICSYQTVKFWQDQGADLCVLGREVTFEELKEIREKCPDIKIETFMHGAMCMSYSGRCLISNYLADRSANQGKCAHCCRWDYKLKIKLKDGTTKDLNITKDNKDLFEFLVEEQFRPGEFIEIEEDDRGSYIMNSKDLCLLPRLNDLLSIGLDSLKVEGRNKTEYYAAVVARTYRKAIDDYYASPESWDYTKYMDELNTLQNRGYCLGFHDGKLTDLAQNYEYTRTLGDWLFAGSIIEWQGDDMIFQLRNHINQGEWIEFLSPTGQNIRIEFTQFEDAYSGEITTKVSAGQGKTIRIRLSTLTSPSTGEEELFAKTKSSDHNSGGGVNTNQESDKNLLSLEGRGHKILATCCLDFVGEGACTEQESNKNTLAPCGRNDSWCEQAEGAVQTIRVHRAKRVWARVAANLLAPCNSGEGYTQLETLKNLLPQYTVARKPNTLRETDQQMLNQTKSTFQTLCK